MRHDDPLRDPELSRHLKAMAERQRAPRSWVREANSVPQLLDPASEPWLVTFLPHLCGVALLLAMAVALWFNGDVVSQGLAALTPTIGDGQFSVGEGIDARVFLVGVPLLALAVLSGFAAAPQRMDRAR